MKSKRKNCKVFWVFILIVLFFPLIISGCANVQHQAKFDQNYKPPEEISVKVARVSNDTGVVFENDIEKLLVEAFEEKLNEKNLLCEQGKPPSLLLESYIIKYREGSAFKRWLLPGWGATELSIRCDLKDEKNNLVGSAVASREIFAGGLYTIGAWKTVFKDVTDDVANDLRDQLKAKGYVVKSRQESVSAVEPQADRLRVSEPPQVTPIDPEKIKTVLLRPMGWDVEWRRPGRIGEGSCLFETRGEKIVAKMTIIDRPWMNLNCERDVIISSNAIKFDSCAHSGIALQFDPNNQVYPFKGKGSGGIEYKLTPK